jgi:hypothetical protein
MRHGPINVPVYSRDTYIHLPERVMAEMSNRGMFPDAEGVLSFNFLEQPRITEDGSHVDFL